MVMEVTRSQLQKQNFILLSIHEMHAERIFAGEKSYELRKVLPKDNFHRVYLYQSGGKGLVGTFEVGQIFGNSPVKLWKQVKEKATTQERFFNYFAERNLGYAIEVINPLKFNGSINKEILEKVTNNFSAPQSFIYAKPGTKLHSFLVEETLKALKKKSTCQKSEKINSISFGI